MPGDVGVIVEGPQLLPRLVEPYLPGPAWGLWLLPTSEFRRTALEARFSASQATSDAVRAQEKLLARNALIDSRTRSETAELGLRVVDVDGQRDLPAMIEHITDLLAPVLSDVPPAGSGQQRGALRRAENDAMMTNVAAWLADLGPNGPKGSLRFPFGCECERLGCASEVSRTQADYTAVRLASGAITAPEHPDNANHAAHADHDDVRGRTGRT